MFIFLKTELLQYQHWICVLFRFYCIKAPTHINFSVACKTQFISEDCKSQSLLVNTSRGKKLSHGVASPPRSKRLYSEESCHCGQFLQSENATSNWTSRQTNARVMLREHEQEQDAAGWKKVTTASGNFQIYNSTPERTGGQWYLFPRPCRFSQPNSELQLQVTESLKLSLLCSLS